MSWAEQPRFTPPLREGLPEALALAPIMRLSPQWAPSSVHLKLAASGVPVAKPGGAPGPEEE